jgi:hypothetical protein
VLRDIESARERGGGLQPFIVPRNGIRNQSFSVPGLTQFIPRSIVVIEGVLVRWNA